MDEICPLSDTIRSKIYYELGVIMPTNENLRKTIEENAQKAAMLAGAGATAANAICTMGLANFVTYVKSGTTVLALLGLSPEAAAIATFDATWKAACVSSLPIGLGVSVVTYGVYRFFHNSKPKTDNYDTVPDLTP